MAWSSCKLHLGSSSASTALLDSGAVPWHRSPARPLPVQAAQTLLGKVVSKKAEKTVIVAVEQLKTHRIYGKRMRQTHRFQAHDPDGKAGLGDVIEIDACRPYSKTKRFMVGKIVKAFDFIVDEETGEVAALGNFEEALPEEEDAEAALQPAEQSLDQRELAELVAEVQQ